MTAEEELKVIKEKQQNLKKALSKAIIMLDNFNNMHGDNERTLAINELDAVLKINS